LDGEPDAVSGELRWPAEDQDIPSPDTVEVRVYPTSFGWFGWTVDTVLSNPVISQIGGGGRTRNEPARRWTPHTIARVEAATETVAVFYADTTSPAGSPRTVPSIHVTGPSVGEWKRMIWKWSGVSSRGPSGRSRRRL